MNKRVLITIGVAVFLVLGTLGGIRFAKGYRLNLKKKQVTPTGLLVANSFPKGAQVFINDKLTTATDDTLNLPPGEYKIKIEKDGYIPWEKTLMLEKELVTQTNARLFPAVPDLKALTFTGAINPTSSPDGQKIAFAVNSASVKTKNGLWVLDMSTSGISFSQGARQIAQNSAFYDFSKADIFWSPDSKEILIKTEEDAVLLSSDTMNKTGDLRDVSAQLPLIISEWEDELGLKRERQWKKLPDEMVKIASESARHVYFSPDEEKMLYTATGDVKIPKELIPPLPATNTQPEERDLKPERVYVYDLKEDKNFFIEDAEKIAQDIELIDEVNEEASASAQIIQRLNIMQRQYSPLSVEKVQWYPTSQHLIYTNDDKIEIFEYDNTNHATVYAGPFRDDFVYPWPDGSNLVILTSLSESSGSANLYGIDLK